MHCVQCEADVDKERLVEREVSSVSDQLGGQKEHKRWRDQSRALHKPTRAQNLRRRKYKRGTSEHPRNQRDRAYTKKELSEMMDY
jgi:hypothetical protein